jgi:hypothetical protein
LLTLVAIPQSTMPARIVYVSHRNPTSASRTVPSPCPLGADATAPALSWDAKMITASTSSTAWMAALSSSTTAGLGHLALFPDCTIGGTGAVCRPRRRRRRHV